VHVGEGAPGPDGRRGKVEPDGEDAEGVVRMTAVAANAMRRR
jgi:hypothetical protein